MVNIVGDRDAALGSEPDFETLLRALKIVVGVHNCFLANVISAENYVEQGEKMNEIRGELGR